MLCRLILQAPNTTTNRSRLGALQHKGVIETAVFNTTTGVWEIITATTNVPDGVRARAKWLRELNLYRVTEIDHMAPKHV